MTGKLRPRQVGTAAVTVVLALALAACGQEYPNTTFEPHSDFGLAIDDLWDTLLLWGTIVFVLVEAALIFVVFRYRRREGRPEPKHVHGNTTLEILWTVLPAVILVLIAVPTVRTIFSSQAEAPGGSLQINVTGHQWWWEFEYPQYGFKTANELYLPAGRPVNFSLRSIDVLHSFWIPQLGGKRDIITNRTNYLWFTPDSALGPGAWNGFCVEYCGTSHANMRFRAFTVSPADFERWAAHQRSPAVFGAAPAAPPPAAGAGAQAGRGAPPPPAPAVPSATPGAVAVTPVVQSGPSADWVFPASLPDYVVPKTPIPGGLEFAAGLTGDATRGRAIFGGSACIGCHAVSGVLGAISTIGPNLTHVGSRTTIGAGLFPNDTEHLVMWIKYAPMMKPGAKMPPQGRGIRDPITNAAGFLDDQQIADIAAFLRALK